MMLERFVLVFSGYDRRFRKTQYLLDCLCESTVRLSLNCHHETGSILLTSVQTVCMWLLNQILYSKPDKTSFIGMPSFVKMLKDTLVTFCNCIK